MERKRLRRPPYNPGLGGLIHQKKTWADSPSQDATDAGFLGWHERGYLPHRDEPGLTQFITFRLADAFPMELRSEWEGLLKIEEERRRRIELEVYLDKGRGECLLRQPEIAAIVEESLLHRHGEHYEMRAWVVMPNHVHLLFKVNEVPMGQLINAWKGYTAKKANQQLGRKGQFWQNDFWDTYMRDEEHEIRSRRYIESNPIKAKLAATAQEWPWSSARFRDEYEMLKLNEK